MSETNGSGIVYPTITLGGVQYVVKFTRGGMLYRLSKSNVSISDVMGSGARSFAANIDMLHAALFGQFNGTAEDLAELVLTEGKILEAGEAVIEALKKVSPPTQTTATGTAEPTVAPAH